MEMLKSQNLPHPKINSSLEFLQFSSSIYDLLCRTQSSNQPKVRASALNPRSKDSLTNYHWFSLVFFAEVAALGHTGHVSLQNIPAHFIVERITEFGVHLKARARLSVPGEAREVCSARAGVFPACYQERKQDRGRGRERRERAGCRQHTEWGACLPGEHRFVLH